MVFWICQALVFFSGFTGLVYQVAWQKYLSNYLGSHASASALVLTVFFLALGLGYSSLGRLSPKILKNQLVVYALLELFIGIYALLSPSLFEAIAAQFDFFIESSIQRLALDTFVTFLFIGFPTLLMGATIPVLTEGLSSSFEVSHRTHAIIYGLNTLGAFVGTLIAGFLLLEEFGIALTLVYSSFLNIAIALVAYTLAKANPNLFLAKTFENEIWDNEPQKVNHLTLLTFSFLSGFYFFSFENLFIKLAGLTLGSTVYTYCIVTAAFIFAIGVGSLLVSGLKNSISSRLLLWFYLSMFLSLTILYYLIPLWPMFFLRIKLFFQPSLMNYPWYLGATFVAFTIFLLLPVGLMGMGLPLLFTYLRTQKVHLASTVGKLYAVNSLGSALGALIGGYFAFHYLTLSEVYRLDLILIVATLLILGVQLNLKGWVLSVTVALPLASTLFLLKPWLETDFSPGLYLVSSATNFSSFSQAIEKIKEDHRTYRLRFTRHDPNTIVHVMDDPNGRALFVNGKPDSHTSGDAITRALTALTPIAISEKIENVFIVGLGGGLSAGLTANFIENQTVTVAEISSGVIDAFPYFADANQIRYPEKIKTVNGDAFRVLSNSNAEYDLIYCEPSNTWVTGVDKLFTREFYQRAAKRLKAHGIFSQWLILKNTSPESFLTVLRTFHSVFPWVTIWSSGGPAIAILGAFNEPAFDVERLRSRFKQYPEIFEKLGFSTPEAILGNQILPPISTFLLADGYPFEFTLDRSVLGYQSARTMFSSESTSIYDLLRLNVPLSEGLKSAKFLSDSLTQLPKSYYEDSIKFLIKWGSPTELIDRNKLLYSLRFPHDSTYLLPEKRNQYQLLLGLTKSERVGDDQSVDLERIKNFFQIYEGLKKMQLTPHPQFFKTLVPSACLSKKCRRAKIYILQKLSNELKTQLGGIELKEESIDVNFERVLGNRLVSKDS